MREVAVNNDEWLRIKRKLMTSTVEEALAGYEPPVRVVHGCEYVTYERGTGDDSESDN
ncbi:hypothetical protein [Collinsella stercoris]|uniref:hypothetical protein n=1 Tax=Collinsella stercoris TaxID=147206 RepID=UPI0012EAFCA8|nr:hypothetical protein [Collinsella stercoris]UEA45187.1 hypothetical protein LK434_08645 [Collinsella stercoris DSM 13279]UWP12288.1 hypothetical protein NQ498_03385 [Collinsella stercoris]